MKPAQFSYVSCETVEEALASLADCGDEAKLLAGGQSLGPLLNLRLAFPDVLIDLNRVKSLDFLRLGNDGSLVVGALVRHRTIETSSVVRNGWPMLAVAASRIGHRSVRNRGTIGGSIAHADPAAEFPSTLCALNATLGLRSVAGTRNVAAREFFHGPFTTALEPDEIVVEIHVPPKVTRSAQAWMEFSRRAGDFGIVGVAVSLTFDRSGRCSSGELFYSGVESIPWRFDEGSSLLRKSRLTSTLTEEIARAAAQSCSPQSDDHASDGFRRRLVQTLTIRALDQCMTQVTTAEDSR